METQITKTRTTLKEEQALQKSVEILIDLREQGYDLYQIGMIADQLKHNSDLIYQNIQTR